MKAYRLFRMGLGRIYKNVLDSVRKRGAAFQAVFNFCFDYKLYWMKRGYRTPLLDRLVFSKIQALLGGCMKFVIVGGAPLSASTHDFVRVCFDFILVQVHRVNVGSRRRETLRSIFWVGLISSKGIQPV